MGEFHLKIDHSTMLHHTMFTFIYYLCVICQMLIILPSSSYLHIMPTILRVYSNYQSNRMVVTVIEFIVKQLYILHRKPFILQMLGSVAPILDMDENAIYGDANKVSLLM